MEFGQKNKKNASLLDEYKIPACYGLVILHQQSKSNVIIPSLVQQQTKKSLKTIVTVNARSCILA